MVVAWAAKQRKTACCNTVLLRAWLLCQDLLDDGVKLQLGDKRSAQLGDQLARDAAFLAELNIMDYSLLVLKSREQPQKLISHGERATACKMVWPFSLKVLTLFGVLAGGDPRPEPARGGRGRVYQAQERGEDGDAGGCAGGV